MARHLPSLPRAGIDALAHNKQRINGSDKIVRGSLENCSHNAALRPREHGVKGFHLILLRTGPIQPRSHNLRFVVVVAVVVVRLLLIRRWVKPRL